MNISTRCVWSAAAISFLVVTSGCHRTPRDRLWEAVNDELARGQAVPTDDVRPQIHRLVDKGADKIEEEQASEAKRAEAEANMRKLVKGMVSNAAKSGQKSTRGLTEVRGADFKTSLTLCPLYPFC